ncbi:MAG: S-methyl-5-thioribose-1-phosphate isomerase [Calditrichota bacterium]
MKILSDPELLPARSAIEWLNERVAYINQRRLPLTFEIVITDDWRRLARAIKSLEVRGAPLIGVAAAYAVALAARRFANKRSNRGNLLRTIEALRRTRPTAVNLFWALHKMQMVMERTENTDDIPDALLNAAKALHEDDRRRCEAIAAQGLRLIQPGASILTICNTGFLATGGIGTALGIVYRAFDASLDIKVIACETRPLWQGARLTAWELTQAGIPFKLIVDSAAPWTIARGMVDICIIGADRIAANGDTANKIGSYGLALACREHNIPFYIAAPLSTVDPGCSDLRNIPIEERADSEVKSWSGKQIAPSEAQVFNPAFDVVPAKLITGIITEGKVFLPPYSFM